MYNRLDLWPTDLNINMDHLLIKDYLPTKFGASGAKHSWVIGCTKLRDTDIPTDRHADRHVQRNMPQASFFERGHKNIYMQNISKKKIYIIHIHCIYKYKLTLALSVKPAGATVSMQDWRIWEREVSYPAAINHEQALLRLQETYLRPHGTSRQPVCNHFATDGF